MGMYTELYLCCEVNPNGSTESVLDFMFGRGAKPKELPKHVFFSCDRWEMVGRCSSYYFVPFAVSRYDTGNMYKYVFSRSDLKNYDSEIEKFLDWLSPFVEACEGDHLGHVRYEEDELPTLLVWNGSAIEKLK